MYAIIKTGGKQYRVIEGYTLKVEKLTGAPGENIAFDQVLMVGEGASIQLGQPYLNGAKVTASIVGHGRGKKVNILKFKRRKNYMKRQGHRQDYTEVKIESIKAA